MKNKLIIVGHVSDCRVKPCTYYALCLIGDERREIKVSAARHLRIIHGISDRAQKKIFLARSAQMN